MKLITLDVGGTAIKTAYFNHNNILFSSDCPSQAREGADTLLKNIFQIIDDAAKLSPFDAIGISTTGQVDSDRGKIVYANDTIPNYMGMELKAILENRYHVPTSIENDVNAAALGEAHFGAGKEYNDFLCLTYGTGVGGAIILDHQLYKGHSGIAAEVGHLLTHPNGRLDDCGQKGCYQQYASTTALVRNAMQINPTYNNGLHIFEAFHRGEQSILSLVDQWIEEIAYGLISLIYVFNPSCIILGGGVMSQPYIVPKLREVVKSHLIDNFNDVQLVPAALGNLAGVYGMRSILESKMI